MLSVCVTSGEEDYPAAIVWKGSKWYFNTFFSRGHNSNPLNLNLFKHHESKLTTATSFSLSPLSGRRFPLEWFKVSASVKTASSEQAAFTITSEDVFASHPQGRKHRWAAKLPPAKQELCENIPVKLIQPHPCFWAVWAVWVLVPWAKRWTQ